MYSELSEAAQQQIKNETIELVNAWGIEDILSTLGVIVDEENKCLGPEHNLIKHCLSMTAENCREGAFNYYASTK